MIMKKIEHLIINEKRLNQKEINKFMGKEPNKINDNAYKPLTGTYKSNKINKNSDKAMRRQVEVRSGNPENRAAIIKSQIAAGRLARKAKGGK